MTLSNNLMRLPISALRVFWGLQARRECWITSWLHSLNDLAQLEWSLALACLVLAWLMHMTHKWSANTPKAQSKWTEPLPIVAVFLCLVTRAQSRCGSGWKAGQEQKKKSERVREREEEERCAKTLITMFCGLGKCPEWIRDERERFTLRY